MTFVTTADFIVVIIGVTENWLSTDQSDAKVSLTGYSLLHSDRIGSRIESGVALYFQKHLSMTLLERYQEGFRESLWCRLKTATSSIIFGIVYRSPDSLAAMILAQMRQYGKYRQCLIMGDVNTPCIVWRSIIEGCRPFDQQLLDAVIEEGIVQDVINPTRIGFNLCESILDSVFTHLPIDLDQLEVGVPIGWNVHYTLRFRWYGGNVHKLAETPKRNFWKMDTERLRNATMTMDWSTDVSADVNSCWMGLKKFSP